MRVLRSGANGKWIFGFSALVFIGAIWLSFFRTSPESWQLIAKGKLVKIEAEQAIYEKPNSPDYFVRVRITNLSAQVVGFDKYKNMRGLHFPFDELDAKCILNDGARLGPVNGMFPIYLPDNEKEVKRSAAEKFQLGKLPRIAPGAMQEFFIVMPKAKTQIARSWSSAPVWEKSLMFLPEDKRLSPFLIVSIDGQLTATNGNIVEWFRFGESTLFSPGWKPSLTTKVIALKFPVKTKTLP